ncbi:hypothetical protein LMG29542_08665 [Paraburkholderia humisilvae]|uniref:Uncharacterized protein n=1 Tax=Paraburkholderia humisilvae TaxID=627669 RepID=A0A6J5FAB9_9BURK|nr:hypothetical protein LMG29542_08665 [Paraburkholderia humisilvae]
MGIWGLIFIVLLVVPLWRVCSRAGFNGAISLIVIMPVIGVFVVGAVLSFCAWPQSKRIRRV